MRSWRDAAAYMLVFSLCGAGNLLAQGIRVPPLGLTGSCDLESPPQVSGEYAVERAKAEGEELSTQGWCWWMTAAKLGNAEAETRVGWLFYPSRPDVSVLYFNSAALKGWIPGDLALSEAYKYGIGVPQSPELAEQWRVAAVERRTTLPPKPVPVMRTQGAGNEWTTGQKVAAGLLFAVAVKAALDYMSSPSSSSSSRGSDGDAAAKRDAEIRRSQQKDFNDRWDKYWAEVDARKREDHLSQS